MMAIRHQGRFHPLRSLSKLTGEEERYDARIRMVLEARHYPTLGSGRGINGRAHFRVFDGPYGC